MQEMSLNGGRMSLEFLETEANREQKRLSLLEFNVQQVSGKERLVTD